MDEIFISVQAACGNVQRALFMKAVSRLSLSTESRRIGEEFFVLGYGQATIARHVGVSRQRVHAVCRDVLKVINLLLETKK